MFKKNDPSPDTEKWKGEVERHPELPEPPFPELPELPEGQKNFRPAVAGRKKLND